MSIVKRIISWTVNPGDTSKKRQQRMNPGVIGLLQVFEVCPYSPTFATIINNQDRGF